VIAERLQQRRQRPKCSRGPAEFLIQRLMNRTYVYRMTGLEPRASTTSRRTRSTIGYRKAFLEMFPFPALFEFDRLRSVPRLRQGICGRSSARARIPTFPAPSTRAGLSLLREFSARSDRVCLRRARALDTAGPRKPSPHKASDGLRRRRRTSLQKHGKRIASSID